MAYCQPVPGDVFREYMWSIGGMDAGGAVEIVDALYFCRRFKRLNKGVIVRY